NLREHDLRGYTDAQGELERLTDEEAARRFDLERAPAIRPMQLQTAEDEHVLLVTMHHIIADAWSMGIVVNELGILYRAFQAGQADPLPALR
ncbi:condensation domain-containing protein, partial [Staphylococcus aureus]